MQVPTPMPLSRNIFATRRRRYCEKENEGKNMPRRLAGGAEAQAAAGLMLLFVYHQGMHNAHC